MEHHHEHLPNINGILVWVLTCSFLFLDVSQVLLPYTNSISSFHFHLDVLYQEIVNENASSCNLFYNLWLGRGYYMTGRRQSREKTQRKGKQSPMYLPSASYVSILMFKVICTRTFTRKRPHTTIRTTVALARSCAIKLKITEGGLISLRDGDLMR